jgi:phosphate transport system permease protein
MASVVAAPPAARRSRATRARSRRIVDKIATASLWTAASAVVALLRAVHRLPVRARLQCDLVAFLDGLPAVGDGRRRRRAGDLQLVLHLVLTLCFTLPIAVLGGRLPPRVRGPRTLPRYGAVQRRVARDRAFDRDGALRADRLRAALHIGIFTALGGALTLTLLNLPAMMRVTQEALAGVPNTYREASMGWARPSGNRCCARFSRARSVR